MKRKAIALCLAMMIGLSVTACGEEETAKVHPVLVDAVQVSTGELVVNTEYIGTVEPQESVVVYPMVTGSVTKVNYKVGAKVTKGATLFEIDSTEADQELSSAEASYESIKKSTELAKKEAREKVQDAMLEEIEALEDAVDAAYDNWQDKKTAYNNDKNGLSTTERAKRKKEVTDAQTAYNNAKSELTSAKRALTEYKKSDSTVHKAEDAVYDAQVAVAEQDVSSAKTQLSYYQVKAPISGVVEAVSVTANGKASVDEAALIISNKANMEVVFFVTEEAASVLKVGDKVFVEKNEEYFEAAITEVGIKADDQKKLFEIKASLGDAEQFSTGTTVKVFADTGRSENTIKIPYDSLYFQGGETYVYCANDGIAEKRVVQTGLMNDEEVEILEGLSEADIVIATWSSQLKPGVAVEMNYVSENYGEETETPVEEVPEINPDELLDDMLDTTEENNAEDTKEAYEWGLPSMQ